MVKFSSEDNTKSITYFNGKWHQGNPLVLGASHHAFRMASIVFDGARSIGGKIPDLEEHCKRVLKSAQIMGLDPTIKVEDIVCLAREGASQFPKETELYISPIFYATEGFIVPAAESAEFVLSIVETPLPEPSGFSACLTKYRRPALNMAPTIAKASCLYPNVARGLKEVNSRGFDMGVVLDPNGNVAEFSYTNLFMCKDGIISTPIINGTFLNGITRQRFIKIFNEQAMPIEERTIEFEELLSADELFGTGNFAKISPCTKIENKQLGIGPVFRKARELYFEYVSTC